MRDIIKCLAFVARRIEEQCLIGVHFTLAKYPPRTKLIDSLRSNLSTLKREYEAQSVEFYRTQQFRDELRGELQQARHEAQLLKDLFTPLQIEAFSLAKRLRGFLHDFESAPLSGIDTSKALGIDESVKQMMFSAEVLTPGRVRLCAKYRADFRSEVDTAYNHFVADGHTSEILSSKIYAVASELDIQTIVVELWKLACLAEG